MKLLRIALIGLLIATTSLFTDSAKAADKSVTLSCVTFSWPDTIYRPLSGGRVVFDLTYKNNCTYEVLSAEYILVDKFGSAMATNAFTGLKSKVTANQSQFWYDELLSRGTEPFTLRFSVQHYTSIGISNPAPISVTFKFTERTAVLSTPAKANATKTGSACKTVNAKGMDGKNPIVCKKNKSGKLVWTSAPIIKATQKATPTVVNFNGSGRLIMSQPKEGADTTPWVKTDASNCFALAIALGIRGQVQRPISSILLFSKTNKVEVRITDGNGSILGVAYPEWKYVDDKTCSFSFNTEVPYSNFYNFAIYTKYGLDYQNPNLIKYSEVANEIPYVFELFRY